MEFRALRECVLEGFIFGACQHNEEGFRRIRGDEEGGTRGEPNEWRKGSRLVLRKRKGGRGD